MLAANVAAYCRSNGIDLLELIFADAEPGPPPGRWERVRLWARDTRDTVRFRWATVRVGVRWWCTPPRKRREAERVAEAVMARLSAAARGGRADAE
ncbi:hypothetical protein NX801_15480 [Streptomyces sp. LP05-1]|uniref:Uncharacterized protein n=1 Tax=Streptomyces pyxinae TaxID=2970734 RepID=A0ABT2CKD2_9ACTN|nr:hypothetical protein [Streptomyces sp. LP05-1]MCS0637039.1 hypothetical protein [Streptomyces sp. LP05-1]